jgi:hypothetical protein
VAAGSLAVVSALVGSTAIVAPALASAKAPDAAAYLATTAINAWPDADDRPTAPVDDSRPGVAGRASTTRVAAIGDSLLLGAAPAREDQADTIPIDAQAGRRFGAGRLPPAVTRASNAALVDRHGASSGRPELLRGDGMHLRPAGAALDARLIAAAVSRPGGRRRCTHQPRPKRRPAGLGREKRPRARAGSGRTPHRSQR